MAKTDTIQEVNRQTGEVRQQARRFDDRDWKWIAEYVIEEYHRRKKARENKERQWKEIDRQVAMEPELQYKLMPDGRVDPKKAWMAEMEIPLQAQALEVLVADTRRMEFPDSGPWFRAHSETSDDLFDRMKGIKLPGLDFELEHHVNQDNVDKIVESFLTHLFGQYDHPSRFDIINAETFKYGIGIGRARIERKTIFINESRGVRTERQKIPVIVPCSVKNLYLEEQKPTLHSATVLGSSHIAHDYIKYESLAIAANKGSQDPDDDDGGWMPKNLGRVVPDKQGYVRLLEMEGDIVVPRKTVRSVVIPGGIITVAMGGQDSGGSSTRAVVRFRFRKYPFSSYILFPYLYESADDSYPTSPLMKGRTVQMTATDALNRCIDAAALKNQPPCGFDPNNMAMSQAGGPEIFPGAIWETMDPVKVYAEVGGDPAALFQIYMNSVQLYAQLTGVLPARLGAQTISHTTAFAKDAELQRGAVRTVDFVNQSGHGPITRWLDMAYRMGLDALRKNEEITFWIDAYGGYITIDKSMLPDKVSFEWFGAGGPAEKQAKMQAKLAALKFAVEMDQINMATGRPPTVNIPSAQREVLREGGWVDLEQIVNVEQPATQGAPGGPPPTPPVPGGGPGNPGAATTALQNLTV